MYTSERMHSQRCDAIERSCKMRKRIRARDYGALLSQPADLAFNHHRVNIRLHLGYAESRAIQVVHEDPRANSGAINPS
jgi:hypothetical protein